MSSPWMAWPSGSDLVRLSQDLGEAHERFVTGSTTTDSPHSAVRSIVLDSWRRSLSCDVDPEAAGPPVDLLDSDLRDYRDAHPLSAVLPVVRQLLVPGVTDDGMLVAITDVEGRLLWLDGSTRLRSRAEGMHFVEGACWSEEYAGTNAPGTALALDHEVQIYTCEHFRRPVQPWSCTAAPIHDPHTGGMLGVLDVTGGDDVASPQMLMVMRSTVAAIEAELRLQRLQSEPLTAEAGVAAGEAENAPTHRRHRLARSPGRLQTLGRDRARLVRNGESRELSLRHAELLVLLWAHPDGMSAEELAVALHEWECSPVTVRAELARLRRILGAEAISSRPYRLTEHLEIDAADVRCLLDRGAHRQALQAYRGPLLPRSEAPVVADLRDRLHHRVRDVLLAHASVDVICQFAQRPENADDLELWTACRDRLPAGSTRRTQVMSHLRQLDRELG